MVPLVRRLLAATVICLGAATGCTSAVDVHSIQSPQAHFERYHAVALDLSPHPPGNYASTEQSVQVGTYVKELAGQILQRRGYALASRDAADLVIRVEAGRRVTGTANTELGIPPDTPYPAPNYDVSVEPPYHGYLDQEREELVEGTFVIDAFDGRTHELVWHGFARAPVTSGKIDYDKLRNAVESVLASFPAVAAAGPQSYSARPSSLR